MNAEETLKEIKKEKQKARKALQESQRRCQELIWAMDEEVVYGQAKMDSDEAKKIAQTLSCAERVVATA
ncbi:MAG: hypothetical protein IJM84_06825, partial [Bacteroidaceae bacterium]|nr:hypothetical protein [Bacteroidaceae bacterium]